MPNPKIKKRKRVIVWSAIGVVAVAAMATYFIRKREVPVSVQTDKVARRSITELVVANGRIYPVVQVKISPEVSGEIIALPVKEGQRVKKGDLLLKIKPDVYIASRNSSEAGYQASVAGKHSAAASFGKAEAEFKRIEELFGNKLVSESNYLEAQTAFEIAKAQLESATQQVEIAKASLEKAKEDLAKTTISSPLDGTVCRLISQLGERVVGTAMMAGTEVMTVAELTEMEARVDIGEIDIPLITIGQKARLEVDAFKDRKFTGTVTEIANASKGSGLPGMGGGGGGQSQEATKFEVKIRIEEKEIFRPGMSVSAEIETRSRTNVLSVPIASVTTRLPKESAGGKPGNREGVNKPGAKTSETNAASATATNSLSSSGTNSFKSSENKKPGEAQKPIEVVFVKEGDLARMAPVKRGISDDTYVEILTGVKEGQEVVSGGYKAISRELEDGKKVKIGAAKSEPTKETK